MKRIAIIDDSEIVLESLRDSLEEAGYSVVTMTEPTKELLEDGGTLDLVLMDVNLPQMYGDDAADLILEFWKIDAPIYLLSDLDEEELAERSRQVKVAGYICKSWGMDRVVNSVRSALEDQPG